MSSFDLQFDDEPIAPAPRAPAPAPTRMPAPAQASPQAFDLQFDLQFDEPTAPVGQLTTSEQRKREDLASAVIRREMTVAQAAERPSFQPPGYNQAQDVIFDPGRTVFDPDKEVQPHEEAIAARQGKINRQGQVLGEVHRQLGGEAMAQPPEGFISRAAAGLKLTQPGVAGYLKSKYPNAAVYSDPKSGAVIIKEPGQPARYLDKPGRAEFGDVADVSGEILETAVGIPLTAAGIMATGGTAAPAVAAGSAAAANLVRQGAAALVPGEDDLSIGERVAMPLVSGITAGASQAAAPYVAKGVSALYNKARHPIRGSVQRMLGQEGRLAAKEGLELATDTGVDLTAGQASGNRVIQGFEGKLRHAASTADDMFAKDLGRIEQLHKGVRGAIERTSSKAVSANEATRAVTLTYRQEKSRLYAARAKAAAQNFGDVDKASGGKPSFSIKTILEKMDDLAAKNQGRPEVLKFIEREKAKIAGRGPHAQMTTAVKFQNKLSDWSEKSAFGKNRKLRQLYTSLADAARKDLDATEGLSDHKVASLLKNARDQYKAASQTIDGFKNDLLETALKLEKGDKPELFIKKLFSPSYGDDQVKKTLGVVAAIDEDAYLGLRRAGLEYLVRQAPAKGVTEEAGAAISPRALVNWYKDNATRIKALFANDPSAHAQWEKLVGAADKLANTKDVGGHITNAWVRNITGSIAFGSVFGGISAARGGDAKSIGSAMATGAAIGLSKRLLTRLSMRHIMGILNDPEQVKLLLRVVQPKTGTTRTQITQAAMQLVALSERDNITLATDQDLEEASSP